MHCRDTDMNSKGCCSSGVECGLVTRHIILGELARQ
jgi:hypothetical protein